MFSRYTKQLLSGVSYLHRNNVIHRYLSQSRLPPSLISVCRHERLFFSFLGVHVFNVTLSFLLLRDIKGGNILIMPSGVLKLIDFGCAKRLYMVRFAACFRVGCGGRGNLVFSTQDSGSRELGSRSDRVIVSCFWAKHFTFTVALSSNGV